MVDGADLPEALREHRIVDRDSETRICRDATAEIDCASLSAQHEYNGRGCDAWSKDDKIVSCGDIEEQMKKAAKCVDAVEKIDSDCLPRLSGRREVPRGKVARGGRHQRVARLVTRRLLPCGCIGL